MNHKDNLFDRDFNIPSDFWDTNTIHDLWELIQDTRSKSAITINPNQEPIDKELEWISKIKNDNLINQEFWKLIMTDKILLKEYLDVSEKFDKNLIILKQVFIKIFKINISSIKDKKKLVWFILEIINREDSNSYRKFVFKYFSYINKKNKKLHKEIVDCMFDLIKLLQSLFNQNPESNYELEETN